MIVNIIISMKLTKKNRFHSWSPKLHFNLSKLNFCYFCVKLRVRARTVGAFDSIDAISRQIWENSLDGHRLTLFNKSRKIDTKCKIQAALVIRCFAFHGFGYQEPMKPLTTKENALNGGFDGKLLVLVFEDFWRNVTSANNECNL